MKVIPFVLFMAISAKSFAANCQQDPQALPSAEQISVIKEMMSTREHRLWHYLWHGLRDAWFLISEDDRAELKKKLPSYMIDPRPFNPNDRDYSRNNNSGEDFLYMHRTMIAHLNGHLAHHGICPVIGWSTLPTLDDTRYPRDTPSNSNPWPSSAIYNMMKFMEAHLKEPAYLRTVSLGQYGHDIETTIHGLLHNHYAMPSKLPERPFIKFDGTFPADEWKWDDPFYDYLPDPYASVVNPVFWKLHGWIDDRINDWLNTNNYNTISEDCGQQDRCYQWKGTWTGMKLEETEAVYQQISLLPDASRARVQIKFNEAAKRMGMMITQ